MPAMPKGQSLEGTIGYHHIFTDWPGSCCSPLCLAWAQRVKRQCSSQCRWAVARCRFKWNHIKSVLAYGYIYLYSYAIIVVHGNSVRLFHPFPFNQPSLIWSPMIQIDMSCLLWGRRGSLALSFSNPGWSSWQSYRHWVFNRFVAYS